MDDETLDNLAGPDTPTIEPANDAQPGDTEASEAVEASSTEETGADEAAKVDEPGKDGADDPHPVPRRYLLEERKRRQEAEKQLQEQQRILAELQGRVSVYQQIGTKQPDAEGPDPEEDLDKFLTDPVGYVNGRLAGAQEELANERFRIAADTSASVMRKLHDDYGDAEAAFMEAVEADRTLAVRLREAYTQGTPPAEFAYRYGKQILRARELDATTLEDFEEKLRAKLEAELTEKFRKENAAAVADQASTSTAGARGSGDASTTASPSVVDFGELFAGPL